MLKEFKEFAMRGNVLDMAVGIIIGAAFGKIITSFVGDILCLHSACCWARWTFRTSSSRCQAAYPSLAAAKAAGRTDPQLRRVPQHRARFPHRRVCDLPLDSSGEPLHAETGPSGSASHQGMSLLSIGGPPEGHSLPALHVGSQDGVTGFPGHPVSGAACPTRWDCSRVRAGSGRRSWRRSGRLPGSPTSQRCRRRVRVTAIGF